MTHVVTHAVTYVFMAVSRRRRYVAKMPRANWRNSTINSTLTIRRANRFELYKCSTMLEGTKHKEPYVEQ